LAKQKLNQSATCNTACASDLLFGLIGYLVSTDKSLIGVRGHYQGWIKPDVELNNLKIFTCTWF
jgi:hypothetical protein